MTWESTRLRRKSGMSLRATREAGSEAISEAIEKPTWFLKS
jgi:hypothetical protein